MKDKEQWQRISRCLESSVEVPPRPPTMTFYHEKTRLESCGTVAATRTGGEFTKHLHKMTLNWRTKTLLLRIETSQLYPAVHPTNDCFTDGFLRRLLIQGTVQPLGLWSQG